MKLKKKDLNVICEKLGLRMRIISVILKSVKLFSPKNSYIRPTLDRAKE